MTDSVGTITQQLAYDEFGNLTSTPPAVGTGEVFRYTGRRFDVETGLYYYRARYYTPLLGRFLQTDPIGYKDDFNLYAYVGNDPINGTDPSGNYKNCAEFLADQIGNASCSETTDDSGYSDPANKNPLILSRLPLVDSVDKNYQSKDATDLAVPLSSLDLSRVNLAESKDFQAAIAPLSPGQTVHIKDGVVVVAFLKGTENIAGGSNQAQILGRHTFQFSGDVSKSADGKSFAFNGQIKSFAGSDPQNYDQKSPFLSQPLRNAATFVKGAMLGDGAGFKIYIDGTVNFTQSGKL